MSPQDTPLPPFELANRVGALETDDPMGHYVRLGAAIRSEVDRLLPAGWSWQGKRCLDFGSGAGRAMRHFLDLTPDAEFWGCDIHEPSIAWLNEHLAPMRGVPCGEAPGLPFDDEGFDLVWATSVFTHLTDHWSGWLLELHRLLRPGGVLIATFLGEGMSEAIAREPFEEDRVGMNVFSYDESFDVGGPNVLLSPWWIRAHWGRGFDIAALEPSGFMGRPGHGHGVVVATKRDVPLSVEVLERLEPGEPREAIALAHHRRHLLDEMRRWRTEARRTAAPTKVVMGIPPEVQEVLDQIPGVLKENDELAWRVVELEQRLAGAAA